MSKNTQTEEDPSIEEILDSIRQIINEEDDGDDEGDFDSDVSENVQEDDQVDDEPMGQDAIDEIDFADPETDDSPSDEGVLDLTERVPSDAPDIDIDMVDPEEIVEDEVVEDDAFVEPEKEQDVVEKPSESIDDVVPEIKNDPPARDKNMDALLTKNAETAAVSAIKELVRKTAVEHNGVTLEDIVRSELKPLLREWLDAHLPTVIERLVQEELERVSKRVLEQ